MIFMKGSEYQVLIYEEIKKSGNRLWGAVLYGKGGGVAGACARKAWAKARASPLVNNGVGAHCL